jgi:hypothetical protein
MELLLSGVEVPVPAGEEVPIAALTPAAGKHRLHEVPADLTEYKASNLPARTMGRTIDEDPLFFAAALASGQALGESSAGGTGVG